MFSGRPLTTNSWVNSKNMENKHQIKDCDSKVINCIPSNPRKVFFNQNTYI